MTKHTPTPSVPGQSAERAHVGHTPVPLVKGYGPNGITGPKTPRIGGPTVQDALRAHAWERNGGAYPEPFYAVISREQEAVVIVPGDRNEREANAEFIVRACNAHEDLLEAAKLTVLHFRRNLASGDCDGSAVR